VDYSDTNSRTRTLHTHTCAFKRYKTITIASRAVPESSATCDHDHATRRVIESVSARVCDPRRASVGVIYYETQKVKSVPQNAPVAPRWLHLQVGELGVSPLSPVPGDPTLKQRDRRRPSREPG
jgi:hypothetical protein